MQLQKYVDNPNTNTWKTIKLHKGNPDYMQVIEENGEFFKITGHYCSYNGLTLNKMVKVSPVKKVVTVWA